MTKVFEYLYHSRMFSRLFHTLPAVLQAELGDCESVLDLGCGPNSPVGACRWIRRRVGVEAFTPYYEKALRSQTHTEMINARIEDVEFPDGSFDAVTLIEVIEHMEESEALEVMRRAQRWAKKKLIVTSPNGFVPQGAIDGNELQQHLSGWPLATMRSLGFRSVGLAGLKVLRRDVHAEAMTEDLLESIRFRPKVLWFAIATISQLVTYRFPLLAFGLLSVKNIE